MKTNSIVIIGFGGIGSYHAQEIVSSDLELYGVYDILEERNEYARSLGIFAYDSFEDVLNDPKVDAVLISTPNDSHCSITLAAIEAGKNVICEKPAAMNMEELNSMIDAANEKNVVFTVNQCRRNDTDYLTAKKIYNERILGDVFHIESKVIGSRGIPGDWRGKVEHGGGMLFDWGIHIIDQILIMTGEKLVSLYADFKHVSNENVDDGFFTYFKFANGLSIHVEVQTCNFIIPPRWYIAGNNGTATIGMWDEKGEIKVLKSWENSDVKPIKAANGFTKTMAPRDEDYEINRYDIEFIHGDRYQVYNNFNDVINNGGELFVTHESILYAFDIIEKIFESVEHNRVIHLE